MQQLSFAEDAGLIQVPISGACGRTGRIESSLRSWMARSLVAGDPRCPVSVGNASFALAVSNAAAEDF